MTFHVVCYRRGDSRWFFADQRAVENSYESYPVLYMTRERAEEYATEFRAADPDCETRVVPIEIKLPEA